MATPCALEIQQVGTPPQAGLLRSSEPAGAPSSIAPETDAGTLTHIFGQVGALTRVGGATPTIVFRERAAPLIANLKARMRAELTTPPNAGSTYQSMRQTFRVDYDCALSVDDIGR